MQKRLAIFDLDGTLYDTRAVNYKAYKQALQGYDAELDRDYFFDYCNGRYYKQFLPEISSKLTAEDMEIIHERKKAAYHGCLSEAKANENLIEMIRSIRGDFHTALVTTASKRNAIEILDYFGHAGLFDLILTQEDVSKKKPDPECFLKAMAHFEVPPEDTIIFEDSESGIEAALNSGAGVCRVMDYLETRNRPDLEGIDRIKDQLGRPNG